MIGDIFPERFSILHAVLQDRPHTFMSIHRLRLRKPAGLCTLAQCTTADTINFPITNHLSAGIQSFHAHSIGMKCRDLFWLPDEVDFQRCETMSDRYIGEMSYARGCQATKKIHTKSSCLWITLTKNDCRMGRSYCMAAGWTMSYPVEFANGVHNVILACRSYMPYRAPYETIPKLVQLGI